MPNIQNLLVYKMYFNNYFPAMFYMCWINSALGDVGARFSFPTWSNLENLVRCNCQAISRQDIHVNLVSAILIQYTCVCHTYACIQLILNDLTVAAVADRIISFLKSCLFCLEMIVTNRSNHILASEWCMSLVFMLILVFNNILKFTSPII